MALVPPCKWNVGRHAQPAARPVFRADGAAHPLQALCGDGKAQAAALVGIFPGWIVAIERVEQLGQRRLGHAGAVVVHEQADLPPGPLPLPVFCAVVQQIRQDAAEIGGVRLDIRVRRDAPALGAQPAARVRLRRGLFSGASATPSSSPST